MSESLENVKVPDVVGEIIGWRAWKIEGTPQFPQLHSATWASHWKPWTWTVAECNGSLTCSRSHDGRCPGEDCRCGMYAAASRVQLVDLGYNDFHTLSSKVVIGQVGLAGKVIPGDQGWRAEKARVVKLYVPHLFGELVEPLRRIYRCEVVTDNTFDHREPHEREWSRAS